MGSSNSTGPDNLNGVSGEGVPKGGTEKGVKEFMIQKVDLYDVAFYD